MLANIILQILKKLLLQYQTLSWMQSQKSKACKKSFVFGAMLNFRIVGHIRVLFFYMIKIEEINFAKIKPCDYQTVIRERHLDVFGHVNNAQYMVLFEEARWEMITARGYGLNVIFEKKISPIILESTIRFKKELRNRESITIRTRLVSLRKMIGTIQQEIINSSGEIAAEATFLVGCFDLSSRKLVQPNQDWLHAIIG